MIAWYSRERSSFSSSARRSREISRWLSADFDSAMNFLLWDKKYCGHLSYNFLQQEPHPGNILQQVVGNIVPLLEVFRAVVGDPDLPAGVLPDQCLQREINGECRGNDHQRGSALGAAKDDHLRGRHLEAGFFGFAAVVDAAKFG